MEFPEKEIFKEIEEELTNKASYFSMKGHEPAVHFDWDRGQYETDEERTEFPFARPAVFVRFGEIDFETIGFRKRGTVPITITVVQDKYADSMKGSDSQEEYLKLLEYKYVVHDVLNEFRGSCFSPLILMNMSTDHRNRNLHVETISYQCLVTLKRTLIT